MTRLPLTAARALLVAALCLLPANVHGQSYWSLVNGASAAYAIPGQGDTPNDYTANARNGSWTGTPGYVDGPFGRVFNTASGVIIAPCTALQAQPWSVLCRVRVTSFTGDWQAMWGSSTSFNGPRLERDFPSSANSGQLAYRDNNVTVTNNTGGGIEDSDWHSVVMTMDATTARLWLDGTLTSQVTTYSSNAFTSIAIGRPLIGSGGRQWPGYIGEFIVYDSAVDSGAEAEFRAGPEPTYTSGSDSGSFTGTTLNITPGITWASYSNGSVTELRDIYIDGLIWLTDSALTSIDMSGELTGGEVITWVTKASNTGGNYSAADRTSGGVTYTAPTTSKLKKAQHHAAAMRRRAA